MFEIWYHNVDGDRSWIKCEHLSAAQICWDAMNAAGFSMMTRRP